MEPFGHGNPEPAFLARNLRLTAPVRIMKERHIRLELKPQSSLEPETSIAGNIPQAPMRAVGWNLAQRALELGLIQGSVIDVAYRIRENDHPEYGGLQIELAGIRAAQEK
jgi:single-stranded-DNA-specific exonuclease